jgi:tetratricopeptide (TPR) repeat protein
MTNFEKIFSLVLSDFFYYVAIFLVLYYIYKMDQKGRKAIRERNQKNLNSLTEKATPAGMLDLIYKGNDFAAAGKRQEAIEVYKSALIYSEKSPNTNFKLAKMYSLENDSDNSFMFLSKAVEDGFNDFEMINNDISLIYLRNDSRYREFATNGYKTSKIQKEDGRPLSRLDELGKLSSLYEKGVLTIEEFENEKKKILSN